LATPAGPWGGPTGGRSNARDSRTVNPVSWHDTSGCRWRFACKTWRRA